MNDYMIEVAHVLKDTTQVTRGAATPDVSTVQSRYIQKSALESLYTLPRLWEPGEMSQKSAL